MIDPGQLALDIVGNAVTLALPAGLWVALFLVAWEHRTFAESVGFGRLVFWLLLPGSLVASLAVLPIGPLANDWLGISLAGGLFPLIVAALAFERLAPPLRPSLGRYLVLFGGTAGILLALVLPVSNPLGARAFAALGLSPAGALNVGVIVAAAVIATVVVLVSSARPAAVPRRVALVYALTVGALAVTFGASQAIPGLGITESFPIYLVTPVVVGLVAAGLASRVFPGAEGLALPTAYVAATFGVLAGADILRQPPLYGGGPGGLYSIGGAGVLDLVYLSGLLAFASAYVGHRLLNRSLAPVGGYAAARPLSPTSRLDRAYRAGSGGKVTESIQDSAAAGRDAAVRAQQVLGVPRGPDDRAWASLGVPGWVVSDEVNLASVARTGSTDGREGFRAWLTARWLVRIGRELESRRLASPRARLVAFGIDLLVVALPAVAIWSAIVASTPGDLLAVAGSVAFNTAALGFVAVAFLYFALAETLFGTTVGKSLVGIEVRDRGLHRPALVTALVRNVSMVPLLTVVGIGVPVALLFLLKTGTSGGIAVSGIAVPSGVFAFAYLLAFVVGGVLFLGMLGFLWILATAERQRLGDLLAGTWVIQTTETPPAAPPMPSPAPPPPPPRSG